MIGNPIHSRVRVRVSLDIKLRVVPLVQYVLDKAKENTSYCPKKVKVKIIHDPAPNAFALGRGRSSLQNGRA